MQFDVTFYETVDGKRPMVEFLNDVRTSRPALHSLAVAGIKKLEDSRHHRAPLTKLVDKTGKIYEMRVGSANIARVFFFFSERLEDHSHTRIHQDVPAARSERNRTCSSVYGGLEGAQSMTDRQASRNEIDEYIKALSDADREAVNSASVALDIAGLAYRARIARGLTQTEAAQASGLKQQAISRIEGGTINVSVRMLERYLRALGFFLTLSIFDTNTGEVIDQTTLNRSAGGNDTQHALSAHEHHQRALAR